MVGLAALFSLSPAHAADRVVSSTGSIHSVSVENAAGSGTRLVYRVQSLDEAVEAVIIPGTDDSITDNEPAILLSPINDRPVIVWTRGESTQSEISVSLFNGFHWTPAVSITQNDTADRRPQIFWGASGYLHIVWSGQALTDGPLIFETVLDYKGVVIAPPSLIETLPTVIVTTTTTGAPTMSSSDALFAVDTSCKQATRVTVQGGYDEPVPVHKRTDFVLPAGSTVDSAKIEVVSDRPVLLVKAGARMYYSYQSSEGWTTLRSITLDTTTDYRSAEIMVRTMLGAVDAR